MKGSYHLTLVRFVLYLHQMYIMARQSITLTQPNDAWLKEQIDSQEYTNKSK